MKSFNMTADDCYYIGLFAYDAMKYRISTEWFREAIRRLPDGIVQLKLDLLDLLSFAEYKIGIS